MSAQLHGSSTGNETAAGVRAAFSEANELRRIQLSLDLREDGGSIPQATANVASMLNDSSIFGIIATRFEPSAAYVAAMPIIAPPSGHIAFRLNGTAVVARPSVADFVTSAVSLLAVDLRIVQRTAAVADSSMPGSINQLYMRQAMKGMLGLDLLTEVLINSTDDASSVAAAYRVFATQPRAVMMAIKAHKIALFVKAYEEFARAASFPIPMLLSLGFESAEELLAMLIAHNVTSTVFVPAWLPFPENAKDSVLVSSFHRAMELFEPGVPQGFAALEGYLAGRIATSLAEQAVRQHHWPLSQSEFLNAAFELGTITVDDWTVGPLSRSPKWCNQGNFKIRELQVSAVSGIEASPGSEWAFSNCGIHSWSTPFNGFLGQTTATGPNSRLGKFTRKGLLIGLSSGNAPLSLTTIDDDYNTTVATWNALELEQKVAALIGCGGTDTTIAVQSVLQATTAFIAPFSGAQVLRRPFRRATINLRASFHDEMAVLVRYLTDVRNATKFWLLVPEDLLGRDISIGVVGTLKSRGLTLFLNSTYPHDSDHLIGYNTLQDAKDEPDAILFSGTPQEAQKLLLHVTTEHPRMTIGLPSTAGFLQLIPELIAKGVPLENVFTTQIMPPLSCSNNKLVTEFLKVTPSDSQNAMALEGFVAGMFVAEVTRAVIADGLELTSQTIIDRIYKQQTFSIHGFALGPFSDACLNNENDLAVDCCNQGSNKVWLMHYNAESAQLEAVSDFNFTLPQCGVDYSTKSTSNILVFVLPSVFGILFIIAIVIGVFLFVDRRRRVCTFTLHHASKILTPKTQRQLAELKKRAHDLEERVKYLITGNSDLLHTPAEHAVVVLTEIRQRSPLDLTEKDKRELEKIAMLIARNRLYSANFQVKLRATTGSSRSGSPTEQLDAEVESYLRDTVVPATSIPVSGSPSSTRSLPSTAQTIVDVTVMTEELKNVAECLQKWPFHPRMLGITSGPLLSAVCIHLLDSLGIFVQLDIDKAKFSHWMQQIEAGYKDNPYHNSAHAVDVLQAMYWLLLQNSELRAKFNDMEILAALTAAAIHDFKHPGVNSNFLLKTLDPLAIRFNGISVLESMHASEAMQLLLLPENNFCDRLSKTTFIAFHEAIVQLVLATDMAQHVKLLGAFNAELASGKELKMTSASEKLLVLQVLIKMADLSNSVRPFEIYNEWTMLVCKEFFAQGAQEKAFGLVVSPFMDEATTSIAKMQTSFLGIVVRPLVDAIIKLIPNAVVLSENLSANLKHWSDLSLQSPPMKPDK